MENFREFAESLVRTCLSPVIVHNQYTGDAMRVPCGTCAACLMKKSYTNEMRCRIQQRISKYCYFVTLTYASPYVPYYTARVVPSKSLDNFVDVELTISPRKDVYRYIKIAKKRRKKRVRGLSMTDSAQYSFSCSEEYWSKFSVPADLSMNGKYPELINRYGYLSHKDFSLFMKRLRKQALKYSDEKIQSFIVGEYTPKRFRPHFHFLLFFDSPALSENIGQIIHHCWPFGRTDYSLSRDDAASYVAGYVGSYSVLPRHLKEFREIRPFSRKSNRLGEKIFASSVEKAIQGDYMDFLDGINFPLGTRTVSIRPWRNVVCSCFYAPGIKRGADVGSLLSLVSSVSNIFRRPFARGKGPYSIAMSLVEKYFDPWFREQLASDHAIDYLFRYCNIPKTVDVFDEKFIEHSAQKLYRLFKDTRSFISTIPGVSLEEPVWQSSELIRRIKLSIQFYHEQEGKNLAHYLECLEHCDEAFADFQAEKGLNSNFKFARTAMGSLAHSIQRDALDKSIKHRELNEKYISFVRYINLKYDKI